MSNLTHQYAAMQHSPFLSGHAAKTVRTVELDVTADNLIADARMYFLRLPADAVVTDVYLIADELDVDGTPALLLDVIAEDESGSNSETLLANSDVGQAGGVAAAGANLPVLTRDEDFYILVEVATAADEGTEGKVRLVVEWFRSRG